MTNGSARTADWWKRLASIIGLNGRVTFSIDGLEDTNHLYRIGANWNKVIKNVSTYIENGGRARWDYLIFDWNWHQITEAAEIAKEHNIGIDFKFQDRAYGLIADSNKNLATEVIVIPVAISP